MSVTHIVRSSEIKRTARVLQLEGLFEVPPATSSVMSWDVSMELPEEWSIGVIVGPSGAGKTTVARELFGDSIVSGFEWPDDLSVVDAFPKSMSVKDITAALSSVGFSSPPAWLRPFRVLSNGEQFRATVARAMCETSGLVVMDEFTSVVDRTVAQIGSAAVAKYVRRNKRQFIAVTCHYDVLDWLEPDWVYEPHSSHFYTGRSVHRRPPIKLEIHPVHRGAWEIFKRHHYLSADLHPTAKCFGAYYDGRIVAFASVLPFAHPTASGFREHRTVCLPDFQGVGIGNALSEAVASAYVCRKPYRSTTGSPAMIRHRAKSPLWNMTSRPRNKRKHAGDVSFRGAHSQGRLTASFEYVGPKNMDMARNLGVM